MPGSKGLLDDSAKSNRNRSQEGSGGREEKVVFL